MGPLLGGSVTMSKGGFVRVSVKACLPRVLLFMGIISVTFRSKASAEVINSASARDMKTPRPISPSTWRPEASALVLVVKVLVWMGWPRRRTRAPLQITALLGDRHFAPEFWAWTKRQWTKKSNGRVFGEGNAA